VSAYKRGTVNAQCEGENPLHATSQQTLPNFLSLISRIKIQQISRIHQEHDEVHEELHPQTINPNFPELNSTPIHHKFASIPSKTNSIQ
jgi:hypothetical protein